MDFYPAKEDRLIYEASSGSNRIKVFDKINGFRYLMLNGVEQGGNMPHSPGRLVIPYFKSAFASLAFLDDPRDFLFIGLGIGAMPSFLRRVMPGARIQVVELDPAVLETAERFFGFEPDERLKVHIGDGRDYVQAASRKFDAVYLDAYHNLSVPSRLTTLEFMGEVRSTLKEGGVAVSNLWGPAANPVFDASVRTLQEAFTELYQFRTMTSNYIYVACTGDEVLDAVGLSRAGEKRLKGLDLGFNLDYLIRSQFIRVTNKRITVSPLRDCPPGG